MEIKLVDPRSLKENPDKLRQSKSDPQADALMLATIKAVGVIEPPIVYPEPGGGNGYVINMGHRRVKQSIAADLEEIEVVVTENADGNDEMRAFVSEIAREPLNPVDQWRAIERLVALEWTEEAIAIALALPVRQIKKLRLLANILPAMLDHMATGNMPNENQLRTIAAASQQEQTQVWKKHKPNKKAPQVYWQDVARGLSKRHIEAKYARFDDDLASAYGITWQDDLFAPADEDTRYTTDVEAFFGAQQEWLNGNLPTHGVILELDPYGYPKLPPKAERIYGKAKKTDPTGWHIDEHTGEVKSIAFRMPKAVKPKEGEVAVVEHKRQRPDVTKQGIHIIGDLQTDALHEALAHAPIEEDTLLALLVLAFAGSNVSIDGSTAGNPYGRTDCQSEAAQLIGPDGKLDFDREALHLAARSVLVKVLSCRDNRSNSGIVARIAGSTVGADNFLANMGTEEFMSCLSRPALEASLKGTGVQPRARVRDTRAAIVKHFESGRFVHPSAKFEPGSETVLAWAERHTATGDSDGEADGAELSEETDIDGGDGEPEEYLEAAE